MPVHIEKVMIWSDVTIAGRADEQTNKEMPANGPRTAEMSKKRSNSQFQGNVIFKALCICNTNEDQGKFLREAPKKMRCNVVYVSIVHFREVKILPGQSVQPFA